jgi:type VI secretion system protein ImpB
VARDINEGRIVVKATVKKGDPQQELPFKILALGDYTGRPDPTPIKDRLRTPVNKDNFSDVMGAQGISVALEVDDVLHPGDAIPVTLEIKSLKDMTPDRIVENVDQLKQLMLLREAVRSLKSVLQRREARQKLESIIKDPVKREQLLAHLGGASDSPVKPV